MVFRLTGDDTQIYLTKDKTALRGADRDGGGAVRLLASHPVAPLRGDGPRLIEPVVSAPRQGMLFD